MYTLIRFVTIIVVNLFFDYEVEGGPLPDGPLIVCSNHGSGWDPFLLGAAFRRQIHYLAKRELFDNPLLIPFLKAADVIGVDREDVADIKSVKDSLKVLKDGHVLGIFPEGTRVTTVDPDNMKEGIGLLAVRSKAPITAVYIDTDYRFRSKAKVTVRGTVDPKDFEGRKKEKYHKITRAVYEKIYQIEERSL